MIDRKTLRLSAVLLVVGFSLYVMVGLLHPDLGSGRLTAIRHQRISGAARPGHPARRRHRPLPRRPPMRRRTSRWPSARRTAGL
jgi:hypothetical protein